MSEHDRLTSRRAFAAGAGVLAAALGAAAAADPASPARTDDAAAGGATNTAPPPPAAGPTASPASPPPGPPPSPNSPARARDLGKLSNVLYNNPQERALFIADPAAYAVRLGLRNISSADLAWFRGAFADGFCCMGCGC
jgi:hypothetical protein